MNENGRRPSPPTSPAQQRPNEKQAGRTRTYLRWFMLLLIGALLTTSIPLPWKVLGLVFGLGAVVMGILALVGAIRHKLPAFLRITTVVGLVAALFLTMGAGASVILWPLTQEYEECMSTALTNQAQRECEDNLRDLGGLLPN